MYLSQMRLNKTIPKTESLTVVWINDKYINYHLVSQVYYKKYKNMKCMKFINVNVKDIIIRDYYLISDDLRTLEEAANLCEDVVGGQLLWFDCKESLHKLLSLFVMLKDVPIIEAIYISLRFNGTKVTEGYLKTG